LSEAWFVYVLPTPLLLVLPPPAPDDAPWFVHRNCRGREQQQQGATGADHGIGLRSAEIDFGPFRRALRWSRRANQMVRLLYRAWL
jgi:hypothetical protein